MKNNGFVCFYKQVEIMGMEYNQRKGVCGQQQYPSGYHRTNNYGA
jgi:hypothetical protein